MLSVVSARHLFDWIKRVEEEERQELQDPQGFAGHSSVIAPWQLSLVIL